MMAQQVAGRIQLADDQSCGPVMPLAEASDDFGSICGHTNQRASRPWNSENTPALVR
jgi:hypothetical protein